MIFDRYFFFFIETICCDLSSKLSRQDDSDEGSQYMYIICRINKNYSLLSPNTPFYLSLYLP